MEPPDGLEIPDGMVLRLRKAIYGLKQAGRQWYLKLKSVLVGLGFTQVINDPHTFTCHRQEGGTHQTLIAPIYVDDLLPVDDKALTDRFEVDITKHFDVTIVGDASYFLGIRVHCERDPDNRALALDQAQFANTILERHDHNSAMVADTLLSRNLSRTPNPSKMRTATPSDVRVSKFPSIARCVPPPDVMDFQMSTGKSSTQKWLLSVLYDFNNLTGTPHPLRYRLRGFLDLISSPLYQIQTGNGMPMTMARPANRVFPPPTPRASYICTPNNGKTNPKRLRRKPINNGEDTVMGLKRTHFRNTFVADVTLAAYVNESIRYKVMGRLGIGLATDTSINSWSSSSQTSHKAEAENSSTDDGHNPMDLSMSRPSIPTARTVRNCP